MPTDFLRTTNMTRLRVGLFRKQGGACRYCGRRMRLSFRGKPSDFPDHCTVDHVVPSRLGGATEDANLVAACYECNNSKGDMTVEQWTALRAAKEARKRSAAEESERGCRGV